MKNENNIADMLNKPLFQATVSDLVEAFKLCGYTGEHEVLSSGTSSVKRNYVYGLSGLSKLFGCSVSTAQRIKSSGILDSAIVQHGRLIVVDADLALELMRACHRQ